MKNYCLSLKHWQLFISSVGLPLLLILVCLGFIVVQISNNSNIDSIFPYFVFILFINLLTPLLRLLWNWFTTKALLAQLPSTVLLKPLLFKICFYSILTCFSLITLYLVICLQINNTIQEFLEVILEIEIFILFFPLLTIISLASFYILFFQAKVLKSVELQKEALLKDYINYFFLLWFYPIGLWIIQPRFNALSTSKDPY